MKTHAVKQGTPEWHKLRRLTTGTASEAKAMMGCDPRTSRNDLLTMKKYGVEKEISEYTQRFLFDRGHKAEAAARLIIEKDFGDYLYPVTVTKDVDGLTLLASMDGLTDCEEWGWEHKLWNQELAEDAGNASLSAEYYWQLEQQLLVTGAEHILFTVSDGTEENMVSTEYRGFPERRAELIAGWKQFAADIKDHEPELLDEPPQGVTPIQLPALRIDIRGEVIATNLREFRREAEDVLENISLDLKTDQDFANAKSAITYCDEVERKITTALDHMMSQTGDIDRARREVLDIREMFRRRRLDLEKPVKNKKIKLRIAMQQAAHAKLDAHISALDCPYMPEIDVDFAGAQKDKKTLKSAQDAIDSELARAKREADLISKHISYNVDLINDSFNQHRSLLPDMESLVQKPIEDMVAIILQRIAEHEAEQMERERATELPAAQDSTATIAEDMPRTPSPWNAEKAPEDNEIISAVGRAFGVDIDVATGWLIAVVLRLRGETDETETKSAQAWPEEDRDGTLYDARGVPWIEEAHTTSKTCTSSGNWRAKKGAGKERIAELEAPYLEAKTLEFGFSSDALKGPIKWEGFSTFFKQDANAQAILADIESAENYAILAQIDEYAKSADLTADARNRINDALEEKRKQLT